MSRLSLIILGDVVPGALCICHESIDGFVGGDVVVNCGCLRTLLNRQWRGHTSVIKAARASTSLVHPEPDQIFQVSLKWVGIMTNEMIERIG